jgi:hypothetical protein
MMKLLLSLSLPLALCVIACSAPAEPAPATAFVPLTLAASTKNQLRWKRAVAFENDIVAALSLDRAELCNELGLFRCTTDVHVVSLGGNDPFVKSQFEPLPAPAVTTPIATERVVLSGCTARVTLDAATTPVLFTAIDFAAGSVNDDAADATTNGLVRAFLARDATVDERRSIRALTVNDDGAATSPRDFAILSCMAIGTLTENIFQ